MIYFSPAAATEIKRLLTKQGSQSTLFRIQIKVGGCCGLLYNMTFDEDVQSSDAVYSCADISVVVDSQSLKYLAGLTLDYSEDLMGGGFRFHNPHATTSCGCGNSFSSDSEGALPLT